MRGQRTTQYIVAIFTTEVGLTWAGCGGQKPGTILIEPEETKTGEMAMTAEQVLFRNNRIKGVVQFTGVEMLGQHVLH